MYKAVGNTGSAAVVDAAAIVTARCIIVNPAIVDYQGSVIVIVDASAISTAGGCIIIHDTCIDRDRAAVVVDAAAIVGLVITDGSVVHNDSASIIENAAAVACSGTLLEYDAIQHECTAVGDRPAILAAMPIADRQAGKRCGHAQRDLHILVAECLKQCGPLQTLPGVSGSDLFRRW